MSALTSSATRTRRSRRRSPRRRRPSASSNLIQFALDVGDALGDEVVGDLVFDRAREDRLRGGNGGFGGGRAHVGQRLSLSLRDLAFRHLCAAGDEFLDLGFGLGGEALGFGLGAGDDRLRLLLGFVLLAPIGGEQGFRLPLEPARLVELGLYAIAARVDALHQRLVHAEIAEHAHEDDEGDGNPEFGFEHRLSQRLSTLLTASVTSWAAGAVPVSRSTIAAAASLAMPRTFAMAADRVVAIVFSASAIRVASFASTSLRRASASAAAF